VEGEAAEAIGVGWRGRDGHDPRSGRREERAEPAEVGGSE
jgi:hypothetical protein